MNILQFLGTPELVGNAFEGESWELWRAILAAAFGLQLSGEQRTLFAEVAGDRAPPSKRVSELWAIAGRRSAKSRIGAAIAVYMVAVASELDDLKSRLAPGERGTFAIVATNRDQAKVCMNYVAGLVDSSPALSAMVIGRDRYSIQFNNRTEIQIFTSSFRTIRGRSLLGIVLDEVAYLRDEQSQTPDVELYRAAIPALSTLNGVLVGISSPYSKRGLLFSKYREHFGKDSSDVLVVQGATSQFNPLLDPQIIEQGLQDDFEAGQAEWLGIFRSDLATFVDRETVEALVRPGPLELPYNSQHRYSGFADASGGGADSFAISICHSEGDIIVIDLVRELRGTPAKIVFEYSELLRSYMIGTVAGDRYAGSWVSDEFRRHSITYVFAKRSKSELYIDALASLNSARVELPPHRKLINQICSLERRTSRAGRDVVDHPAGGGAHDDLSNSALGAVALAASRPVDCRPYLTKIAGL